MQNDGAAPLLSSRTKTLLTVSAWILVGVVFSDFFRGTGDLSVWQLPSLVFSTVVLGVRDSVCRCSKTPQFDYSAATFTRIGGREVVMPPVEEVGLFRREGKLVPVHNVTSRDLANMMAGGRTFSNVFAVLKAYQNITGRPCMAMHHLEGYEGDALRVAGILVNGGRSFIRAINPVINGYDERRATVRYVPTLCPDKTVDIGEKRIAVSLSYIKYESLLEHADHIHRSQTKEAGSAITTAGHHGPLSGAPKHRYLHVESEWFENDVAVCLQALQDEFEGYDLCSGGQNIHRTKEDLARAKSPLPYSENIRSDIAPLPEQ